jgi:glucosamine--fructose-6-phosphate aminotransferase (isomerizing)
MCGIVGYVGAREAGPFLIEGLRRLEYRGYDSAGAAFVTGERLVTLKAAGRVEALARDILGAGRGAKAGIAHTRWATHGQPTGSNAHPHSDCRGRLAIVHNGIVENHRELRDHLEARGHRFRSETDTETVAHLLEAEADGDLAAALRRALSLVRGSFAIAVVSVDRPACIVAARRGSPMVVGIGRGEHFLASDMPALLPFTREQIVLEDGDLAVLTPDHVDVQRLDDGTCRQPPVTRVEWSIDTAEKGGHPHFMLKEILEQPRAIADTLAGRGSDRGPPQLGELGLGPADAPKVGHVELIGCGTSWHAALVGKRLMEDVARLPASAEVASEYRYRPAPIEQRARTLAVAISQSGETADTLAALRRARQTATAAAITNVVGSSIAREAGHVLYTRAGPEISVASTKAFTTQLAALLLLAIDLARARDAVTERVAVELCRALWRIPDVLVASLPSAAETARRVARRLVGLSSALYLGRGYAYPLALEGALKMKEITYVHADGYPAGEMKHGPIALVDPDTFVVVVAPNDRLREKTLSNLEEVKARRALVIAIGTEGDRELAALADEVLWLPPVDDRLVPLVAAAPLQLLAYELAVAMGRDIDRPRNLAKSVTVE